MGQVYLGVDGRGRRAAVKVVHSGFASDELFRKRFELEVAASRRVAGERLASVIDADPQAPVPWLATEYVAGPSLTDAVECAGPLPVSSVHVLASGIAEALAAIHSAGLVHRDVKPSNVLLGADGPRLIDFGISRAVDETHVTATGVVYGTPAFMSPEQAEGGEAGPASDVFSFGAVVVHALRGRGPFGDGVPVVLLRRISDDEPDLGDVQAPFAELVAACLAKSPADRPTAGELIGYLERPPGVTPDEWLPAPVRAMVREAAAALPDPAEAATVAGPDMTTVPGRGTLISTSPPAGETKILPTNSPRRRVGRRAVLAGAGLAAVGGAAALAYLLTTRGSAPAPSVAPTPAPAGPAVRWSLDVEDVVRSLAVQGGIVYVPDGDVLRALDAETGTPRWTGDGAGGYVAEFGSPSSGVASADGFVLFETAGGVAALDAESGAWRWGLNPDSGNIFVTNIGANVAAAGDGVYIALAGSVHAVDAATGAARWRFEVPLPADVHPLDLTVNPPVPDRDQILVSGDATVTALDMVSGRQRWRYTLDGRDAAALAVSGGTVFASFWDGPLVALDSTTGVVRWEMPVGNEGTPSGRDTAVGVMANLVLVRGRDQRVRALDAVTGELRWSQLDQTVDGARADFGPVFDEGVVYFAGTNGRVYALDPTTGFRRWEYGSPTGELTTLAAASGTVFVGGFRRVAAITGGAT